jgi:GntR family transcriptional regulator
MDVALHRRIAEELRRRIVAGELAVGARLPSEARLVAEFGASRGTVRQALAALRAEGLVGGGQGRPPEVLATVASPSFDTFLSFTRWAREAGRTPGQRTVEVARRGAAEEAARALGIAPGQPVVEVLRLRLLDGVPAMLERASFVEDVGRLLFDFDPDRGSIYAYLIDRGVDLARFRHTFDAVAAGEAEADLLGVPAGAPLLRERRRATSRTGTPLEYGDDRYRPDIVTFTVENARDHDPTLHGWRSTVDRLAPVPVAAAPLAPVVGR